MKLYRYMRRKWPQKRDSITGCTATGTDLFPKTVSIGTDLIIEYYNKVKTVEILPRNNWKTRFI